MTKRSTDIELMLQAFENVGNTFGGNTKTLLHSIVREVKRLKRYEEDQINREAAQRFRDAQKEFRATGKWPSGYGSNDDDIPF